DHVDRGVFGASYLDLGDPQRGANPDVLGRNSHKTWLKGEWLGADHSAPYLVPKQLYYDKHPEYFAVSDGKRLPKDTLMQRMSLCLSQPDVHRIAAERMAEWMGIQSDRRFFYCTDADSEPCRCPSCLALDPLPYYNTDRYLAWVNSVAAAARKPHPDKALFAFSYISTAKPSVRAELAPNVILLYCPWFWTSANIRADYWAHPRNITAMEEFMGWAMKFPGQIGVYDYPGHDAYMWMRGHEKRLKFYAKNGVRTVYCCGCTRLFNGLFHYVASRLNWDPFLDSGQLEGDYLQAVYGQAAPPLVKYIQLDHAASERQCGRIFSDEEMLTQGRRLFREAEQLVANEEPMAQMRVQREALAWLESYLRATDPRKKTEPVTADELTRFKEDAIWYVGVSRRFIANCQRLGRQAWLVSRVEANLKQTLADLSIEHDKLLNAADRTIANPDVITDGIAVAKGPVTEAAKKSVTVAGVDGWSVECTTPELALPPTLTAAGDKRHGVRVQLSFTKLPTCRLPLHPEGTNTFRVGTFLLQKRLAEPVDIKECHFVEFHFIASTDVPVTLYLDLSNVSGLRSDLLLHAGEQIVRLDWRQHAAGLWGKQKEQWDGKLTGVKVDFWPQDNFYPHPAARDAEVTLLGVTACNHDRTPTDLPYLGKALWLTQYRSNIPHNIVVDKARLRQKDGALDYQRYSSERFRTWTSHRALTPVFAIVADAETRDAAQAIQSYLEKLCGARLPINPPGVQVGPDLGNAIILGRKAGLSSGRITEQELKHVRTEGYVLRAHQGRIVIAGATDASTAFGVARYLEDHGARFFEPGVREVIPDLKADFLHELYLLDWPFFAQRGLTGGWQLACQRPAKPFGVQIAGAASTLTAMAEAIKDCGRQKKREVSPAILAQAGLSPMHRYVAAKLLWDPFLDTSRLIREFQGKAE
ncbi:MAG: DUF4838 domain-containing protein, partial [Planctomycetes bacterium]|nr:DUF4838 domain-containing protein [Planctomycetota bacterium]